MAKAKIEVDGKSYPVAESLGYQPSSGMYAKIVEVDGEERTAVRSSRSEPWRFWTVADRLR